MCVAYRRTGLELRIFHTYPAFFYGKTDEGEEVEKKKVPFLYPNSTSKLGGSLQRATEQRNRPTRIRPRCFREGPGAGRGLGSSWGLEKSWCSDVSGTWVGLMSRSDSGERVDYGKVCFLVSVRALVVVHKSNLPAGHVPEIVPTPRDARVGR